MEHASALLEHVPQHRQGNLGAPGFWRDLLLGMLKPVAAPPPWSPWPWR